MNEMLKWKEEVKKMTQLEKLDEQKNLTLELQAHIRMLEEFGINRTDIKSRRLLRTKYVNGRWQFCDKMCEVKLKNGTEHVVSRELVFTALHPMSEQEKRNHRLVA